MNRPIRIDRELVEMIFLGPFCCQKQYRVSIKIKDSDEELKFR